MKRLIIIALSAVFTLGAISQTRIIAPKEIRDRSCAKPPAISETSNHSLKFQNSKNAKTSYDDEAIGRTWYDLQTNASVQNRMFLYPDGFIGGTFTYGENFIGFSDIGTGYNKYDSYNWGTWPTERIESDRCGWPSYSPWGPDGEIVVAHYFGASTDGLVFSRRTTKGTGNWTEFDFMGPDGHALLWSRMIASGADHETIHLLALTNPIANGGTIYQGQDGALVYSRSSDGGTTWDIENTIIDGLGYEYYNGFDADTYEFAYPKGDTIAMLIGHDWTDLILLKSIDNGNTWIKTLIWEHPYPLFDPNNMIVTDTFYCADGSHSIAIDNSGKVHVAFGINRAICDGSVQYWFPLVDGVGYWNEDMPVFSNHINALSPYGEPGTELIEDYNLIGWMQDINGNGTLDILDDIAIYYMGPSSMPQLVTDDQEQIFLVYSSITETYNQGIQNYRHLWARGSNNNGFTWGDFHHLTSDLIYIIIECVFPSCSPTTDENIRFLFQADNQPGMAVRGDEDPYEENYIHYYTVAKSDIIIPDPGNTLTGIVTDAVSGFPVEDATVSLSGTSFSATTGTDGYYFIINIPPGDYTAVCSKMGYLNVSFDVTIVEYIPTTQDFELEEATGLEPPENLTATVFDQNNVLLEWDPPLTGTPIGYHVYRNNNNIGFFNTTSANDFGLATGTYEYFVTAVYEIGESLSSNTVEVTISEPLLPPVNLVGWVDNNDVILMWDPPLTGTPLGYNVYRDGLFLAYTTESTYIDEDPDPGTYEYYITSVYDEGESDPSNIIYVYIPEPCYPPENVTATVINITEVELTWDPPISGSNPIGYNVYQDGLLIGFVTNNQIYFAELGPGTYEFCVSSVCEDGESEPACADPVTITLLSPTDLTAESVDEDIVLNWFAPELSSENVKGLLGYNVYYGFSPATPEIIDYVTQITYTHEGVGAILGLHTYYVTAVYDEGESLPSNEAMVDIVSVEDHVFSSTLLYPNPAKDYINIEASIIIEKVKIYNYHGEVVEDKIVNKKICKINTSKFTTGLYFFQIKTSEGMVSKRVIIE